MRVVARKRALSILRRFPRVRWWVRRGYWRVQAGRYDRLACKLSVDPKLVFFEAFGGRSFACSPKALYERMLADERFAGYRFVWSFKEGACSDAVVRNPHTRVVARGSEEYFKALAQAGSIILNARLPEYVTPKPGQVFVQCWHGTPLKRLGYDVATGAGGALNTASELAWRFGLDMRKWTYLLSPSPYASQHLADAFGLPQERRADVVVEEGYPRNDALVRARNDANAQTAAQRRLGLPHGKKVLLYAPTWRDDSYAPGVGYTFDYVLDLGRLRSLLDDSWIVLFRAHYYIAHHVDLSQHRGFAFDVSSIEDVNQVYLASDVLLTDYSSVMFDFALLERPMVLYAPDVTHYEHDVRGFYFPLEEVPAPLCTTVEEVSDVLNNVGEYASRYGARRKAFLEKFAPRDDGYASCRVLDRVFFGS